MKAILCLVFLVHIEGYYGLNLGTTCPSIFQYGIDKINDLYGEIWVPDTENHILNLEVQMSIANSLTQVSTNAMKINFNEPKLKGIVQGGRFSI